MTLTRLPETPRAIIREHAGAKINLSLRILGRRTDGYHEIESLVAFAEAGDVLTVDTGRAAGVDVTGPFAADIDGINLLDTALNLLVAAHGDLRLGRVGLEKRLPVAAGIGGGSADAAALLRAVSRANPSLAASIDWAGLAVRLGADVSVCLGSRPAMMRGIGERIEAVDTRLTLDAVLVNPRLVIPARKTALVFSALAAPPVALTECERPMPTPLDRARLLEFMRRTGNDLTAAALKVMPGIGAVLAALETANGAEIVQLSGAGPTCFAIFPGREDAMHAAARLREDHPRWWIEVTRLGRAASATA